MYKYTFKTEKEKKIHNSARFNLASIIHEESFPEIVSAARMRARRAQQQIVQREIYRRFRELNDIVVCRVRKSMTQIHPVKSW